MMKQTGIRVFINSFLAKIFFGIALLASSDVLGATPEANFTHAIDRNYPLRVQFTDKSTPQGEITAWKWDFGDGTPVATTPNPTHIYNFSNDYKVTLTVNRGSQQSVYTKTIVVSTELKPIFTVSATSGSVPLTVELDASASTGTIKEQSWIISPDRYSYVSGDSRATKAKVEFKSAGTYTVILRVTDGFTIVSSSAKTITVKTQPAVNFEWDSPVYVGRPIQFRDKTQYPCPNGITQTWEFPFPGSGSGPTPVYTFSTPGKQDVKLCVRDACGNSVCATKKVDVLSASQSVFSSFTASRLVIKKGESVDFYDTSSPRTDIKRWAWYFELPPSLPIPKDLSGPVSDIYYTSYREKVSHTFPVAGIFKVRLEVSANDDLGTFYEVLIEVRETPELKPSAGLGLEPADVSLYEDLCAKMVGNSGIYISKKVGGNESRNWEDREGFTNSQGWGNNKKVWFYDMKLKGNRLIVMKNVQLGGQPYSYYIFENVGTRTGVQSGFNGGEIPAGLFQPNFSYGTPVFDLNLSGDEVVVACVEATDTYLYLIRKGTSWYSSTVTRVKLKDGKAKLGRVFIDETTIVTQVDGMIYIFEKENNTWDFSKKKILSASNPTVVATAYANHTIMAAYASCTNSKKPIVYVYQKPSTGWVDGQTHDATLSVDDSDISETNNLCVFNANCLDMSERYAVLRVNVWNGTGVTSRKYIYKRWYDFWVNSNQTYKVLDVSYTGGYLPSETSNYDFINGVVGGKVSIYNYDNYCMLEPYTQATFTIRNTQFDVVKGDITLGGGGEATFTKDARAKYKGRSIKLMPGIKVQRGAKVSFKAVSSCDELYFK